MGGDGDIIQDLLKPANVMCNVGHTLKLNRFLCASLLVRGKMKSVVGGENATSAGGFGAGSVKTRNIEIDDVNKRYDPVKKKKKKKKKKMKKKINNSHFFTNHYV